MVRSAAGCAGGDAEWRADWHHSIAGDVRQYLLWRDKTEPVIYGSQPVILFGLRGDYRGAHYVEEQVIIFKTYADLRISMPRLLQQFETLVLKGTVSRVPGLSRPRSGAVAVGIRGAARRYTISASAKAARRAAVNNSNFREQKVAHAEYVKKHAEE